MERLAHSIREKVSCGAWKPIRLVRHGPPISHLFFADDMILFSEASASQVAIIEEVLRSFSAASGQKVSIAKTSIFFSKNVEHDLSVAISSRFGFCRVSDLGKYLGVPLLHKRVTRASYHFIVQRVRDKLSGWMAKSLSLAGRITLAKSVLSAIPYYAMQSSFLPKGTCRDIESLIRNFIWGKDEGRGVCIL
ncbi:hypothetical protein like AT3G24255 [Hibiscus trionum]|uniref:Reverse transcriptase n=1 Tax=Hibiscus trionum TaxID=183268 RepID=A0A9W7LPL3_HIBTR|nr:hypothetical protein like AT3G24255 [Hibiscus trionum]